MSDVPDQIQPKGEKLHDTVYVSFMAELTPTTSEGLLSACVNLANRKVKTIYLLFSSPGGAVTNGIHIYNVLRALPCKVVTHNVGAVDSIANVIFLAGQERYANAEATFMFHGVGWNLPQAARLEEKLLLETLDSLRADNKRIAAIFRDRASFPAGDEIESLFLKAATKDAEFAKERGIIHEIREAKVPDGAPVLQLVFKR